MQKPLPRRTRGFTLIEMIAAFVVFAIAVGALMQILTMSMNNARRSTDETRAALWAQSMLDNVGVGERVEAGSTSGEFDRSYRWELQIDQIDPELIQTEATEAAGTAGNATQVPGATGTPVFELPQIDLYHVVLTVIWGDRSHERSAQFSTLRTATPDAEQGHSLTADGRSDRALSSADMVGGGKPRPSKPAAGGRK